MNIKLRKLKHEKMNFVIAATLKRRNWRLNCVREQWQKMSYRPLVLYYCSYFAAIIVNRVKWLGRPINVKESNKQAKIYAERSLTLPIFCLVRIDSA